MTTVAIMQPTYLPWLGYFDMLDQADVFVLLDTVAVSPKSWQTRNRIRARDGNIVWLSVPTNARRGMHLSDVRIANEHEWQWKHWRALESAYEHAPHRCSVAPATISHTYLAGLNDFLIRRIADRMGIRTSIARASRMDLPYSKDPFRRVANICAHVGATELLNTPGAKDWLDGHDVGVPVRWHEYEHPIYSQGNAPFFPFLSVVDLLAWHGPASLDIIRSGRR